MQPYLGVSAFSSTVEKSVFQSVFIVLPVRFVFCFPARSDRFHLIVDKYRPGTRERERKREEGREGSSRKVEHGRTANCSPIRFHGYTGRGAETICLAGRTPFPRQENRLPVFLLLLGLFQACFPYGQIGIEVCRINR